MGQLYDVDARTKLTFSFSSTIRRPIRSKNRMSVMSMQSVSTVSSEEAAYPAARSDALPSSETGSVGNAADEHEKTEDKEEISEAATITNDLDKVSIDFIA